MNFEQQLTAFRPCNEQEAKDRDLILHCLQTEDHVFERQNLLVHMTASAWVTNPSRTKVLMAFHNLYQSWAWLGGHADGETDLLSVALREVREESGLRHVRPVTEDIFSLEALPVFGHEKRGVYVPCHTHLNLTYLLEADEAETLTAKPDENSGVKWFSPDEAIAACTEPWMAERIYTKLNEKLRAL